jgi:serine/threonine-protein kinase
LHGPTSDAAVRCAASESSPGAERQPPLRAGEILADKYRIDGLLGRGGMGTVYAAVHVELGLRVAIKVPHLASRDAAARLVREARTCALFANNHIPRIFDLGQIPNGAPFIVMERLEGEDLAHLIARGPVRPECGVAYVRQACAALSDAHAAGIVHRDLKPANLFLAKSKKTGPALLKVLDFGICKRLAAAPSAELTLTSAHLGSPQYMSPEQIRAQRDVDQRTDIWSLGVIFYELLTGKAPFGGTTLFALSVAIATEAPRPPSHCRADLPAGLEGIVLRCLEKDPAARFASAKDLMRAIKPFV